MTSIPFVLTDNCCHLIGFCFNSERITTNCKSIVLAAFAVFLLWTSRDAGIRWRDDGHMPSGRAARRGQPPLARSTLMVGKPCDAKSARAWGASALRVENRKRRTFRVASHFVVLGTSQYKFSSNSPLTSSAATSNGIPSKACVVWTVTSAWCVRPRAGRCCFRTGTKQLDILPVHCRDKVGAFLEVSGMGSLRGFSFLGSHDLHLSSSIPTSFRLCESFAHPT